MAMRSEGRALDLNQLPQDLTREDSEFYGSASANSGKRRSIRENESMNNRMYACRFCSLKFYKSQALGGHMNRHRHEREAETLDTARQLVYTTDQTLAPHLPLGSNVISGTLYQRNPSDGYHALTAGSFPTPNSSRFFSHLNRHH